MTRSVLGPGNQRAVHALRFAGGVSRGGACGRCVLTTDSREMSKGHEICSIVRDMTNPKDRFAPKRFGALVYKTRNLGDEIQSLAAMRFLPRVDAWVDRDNLATFDATSDLSLILNGWFGERPSSWPPSSAIHPLLISLHLSPLVGTFDLARVSAREFFLKEPAIRYLHHYGPVGARDLDTLEVLEKHQVPAYFSGCLTLTLQPTAGVAPTEEIVLNDVPDEVVSFVKQQTSRKVVVTTHLDDVTPFGEARLSKARELLRLYQPAHLVITTRLHCALPCLALGTKVILLRTGQDASRLRGLESLVKTCSVAEFISGRVVDLDSPEPNRTDHLPLRAALEAKVSAFVDSTLPPGIQLGTGAYTLGDARFQTLLAIHAELLAAQDVARKELERSKEEYTAVSAERDRLKGDVLRLDNELRQVKGSQSWKLVVAMRAIAARFPLAAAPLRRLLTRRSNLKS
jgi:Polysaccharide pyruvyl transferase